MLNKGREDVVSLVLPSQEKDPVKCACGLLVQSRIHRYWTVRDLYRLIIPPIERNQCIFAYFNANLIGFCTWGCFSKEVAQHFISGIRVLTPYDWESGDDLWIVDAIAPYGYVSLLGKKIYALLKERFPSTPVFHAIRHYPNRHRRIITCHLKHFSHDERHNESKVYLP
jgi:hemolysin-activating ACP:hemolysin acyltransferase